MASQTRPTTLIFIMTGITVIIAAVLGALGGIYLGKHYRPRTARVQIARQPPAGSLQPTVSPPSPPPATAPHTLPAPTTSARHPASPVPKATPRTHLPTSAAKRVVPPLRAAARSGTTRKEGEAPGHTARGTHPGLRTAALPPHPRLAVRAGRWSETSEHGAPPERHSMARRAPAVARPEASRLRPVGVMHPVRALPVPRRVRQQRVARAMAAARRRRAQIATSRWRGGLPGTRSVRLASGEQQPAVVMAPPAPLSPAERARVLARARQTVRYVEQVVTLEGRPATLATYIAWEGGKPRTFSFARQDRRTDLAKIVRVDEAARQVTVLVPDRGALIQTTVPTTAVVVYGQALQVNPPSPELVARADALLAAAGAGPPAPPLVAAAPAERVAGMREEEPELVGVVRRVDPASRLIVLAGPRGRTPFRVAEGIELPVVGQIISITTTEAPVSPRPATSVTLLQPTVAGVVTLVRPTAVELSVRTVSPDGQVEEVPVPVSGDARVFISGQPGDLRALRKGIYIRAYMTPTGEARILGAPSEQ